MNFILDIFYKVNEIYGKLDGGNGYVYILQSAGQPGICKIVSTERTPEERCAEINRATGVLIPFSVTAAFRCKALHCVEKIVHRELESVRLLTNKEGFAISKEKAIEAIQRVIEANEAEFKITEPDLL